MRNRKPLCIVNIIIKYTIFILLRFILLYNCGGTIRKRKLNWYLVKGISDIYQSIAIPVKFHNMLKWYLLFTRKPEIS